MRTTRIAIAALAAFCAHCSAAPLRPTTITWGGYNGNDQFAGHASDWPFVQKYMDGYVMHGAYWIAHRHTGGAVSQADIDRSLTALGAALSKYYKPADVETGLVENERNYNPAQPRTRSGYATAEKDIAHFKHWATFGVHVGKVRVDWFPLQAAAVYAQHFQITSIPKLMLMVTGDTKHWPAVAGFDPAIANWREYAHRINDYLPHVKLGFDQAPCNFYRVEPNPAIRRQMPWPGLGWGYRADALKFLYNKKLAKVDGKLVPFSLDFADLMNSVAISTREQGLNFYAFECDTPYSYITDNKGREGKELLPFLLRIERMQHRLGFHYSKIINDSFPLKNMTHDQWDQRFHDRTLAFLETYQGAGGRADQYIAESWYKGPYTYFPETKSGTFSNLARDLIRRVRGIDDNGKPFSMTLTSAAATGGGVKLTLTNDGHALNPGDCKATPLLRATIDGTPGKFTATTAKGKDVTAALLHQGQADGWFTGGLEPGQSVYLILRPQEGNAVSLKIQAYWNPQDPSGKQRAQKEVKF